jgi:hypothetical protein
MFCELRWAECDCLVRAICHAYTVEEDEHVRKRVACLYSGDPI